MKRWLLVLTTCLSVFATAATTNSADSGSWENTETDTVLHLLSSGQLIISNSQYFGQTWENTPAGLKVTYLSRDNRSTQQVLSAAIDGDKLTIGGNTPISGTYSKTNGIRDLIHVSLGRYRGPNEAQFATVIQYNTSNEAVAIDHFDLRGLELPESFSVMRPSDSRTSTTFLSNNSGAFAYALGSTNSNTLRLLRWTDTEAADLQTLYTGEVIQANGQIAQVRLHLYDNGQFSRFTRSLAGDDQESADEGNYQRVGDTINLFSFNKPPMVLKQVNSSLLTVQTESGNVYMGQVEDKLNAFPLDGPISRFDGLFFPRAGQNGEAGTLNLISCANGQHYTLVPSRTVQQMIGQFQANPSKGFLQVAIRAHRVPREQGTDDRFWVTDWYRDQAPGECGRGMQTFAQMMSQQAGK